MADVDHEAAAGNLGVNPVQVHTGVSADQTTGQGGTVAPVRKVRAGVGEGDIVGVTVQLPKPLYEQIKSAADSDERTVPHYLLRKIREMYTTDATPVANSIK